jgi:HK97 family phage major capsid protein
MKKSLIQALRAEGYNGSVTDIDAVEKWCTENGVAFKVPNGKSLRDVLTEPDKAVEVKSAPEVKSISIDAANDAGEDGAASHDTKSIQRKGIAPLNLRRKALAKAYDRDANAGKTVFGSSEEVEVFVAKTRLSTGLDYPQKQNDLDIIGKVTGMTTVSPTQGNALTFPEFEAVMIRLVQEYGVSLRACPPMNVATESVFMPRRTGGITPYYPGQGVAITESNPTANQVLVAAKQGYTLSTVSESLLAVEAISVGDFIAKECATTWALDADQKFFNGNGAATTYHNFLGWGPAMLAVTSNTGVVVTANAAFASTTPAELTKLVGTLPLYPGARNEWYMSQFVYWTFLGILYGLGGVPASEMINGPDGKPKLLGYPVNITQVMPVATAASTIMCYFGDPSLGSKQIEVGGGYQMKTSDQRYFDQGLVAFRSGRYWGLTVHDPGTNGTAGPVVALQSHS